MPSAVRALEVPRPRRILARPRGPTRHSRISQALDPPAIAVQPANDPEEPCVPAPAWVLYRQRNGDGLTILHAALGSCTHRSIGTRLAWRGGRWASGGQRRDRRIFARLRRREVPLKVLSQRRTYLGMRIISEGTGRRRAGRGGSSWRRGGAGSPVLGPPALAALFSCSQIVQSPGLRAAPVKVCRASGRDRCYSNSIGRLPCRSLPLSCRSGPRCCRGYYPASRSR